MALTAEQALQEQIRLQTEFNRLQEESKRLADEVAAAGNTATQAQRDALAVAERVEKEGKKALDTAKRRTKEFDTVEKKSLSAFRSFARLSSEVQSNLGTLTNASNTYIDIQREIIKLEEQQVDLDETGIEAAEARAAFLREISQSQLSQAQATAKAMEDAKGINEFEAKRLEIQQNSLGLSDQQKQMALDALEATEAAFKKEQRILAIKESQKELYEAIPDSMRSGIDFAKQLGDTLKTAGAGAVAFMLLAAVVTSMVAAFTALDAAAEDFRKETGLTNSQTKEITKDANAITGEFRNLGVEAKDVFDTVSALKTEFGDIYNTSRETTAALTVLSANFGVAAKDAAKVQGVYERMGGVSAETAANLQMQAAEMANMAGVAPAKVAEDIAEAAEESYKFFKGDVNALTAAAIQARRLGTNLKDVLEVNKKLLDFEGGIEDELVAATFAGGQFNLTQARTLAASGKHLEAQEEILRQVQRTGDFRDQDLFTQEALAKGAGMEVEEIIKQLDAQEKLATLSEEERTRAQEAIRQGLDITDINAEQLAQKTEEFEKQKEIQGSLTNVKNTFDALSASLGTTLLPVMQALASVFEFISSSTAGLIGFVGTLVILFGALYAIKLRTLVLDTRAAILKARETGSSIIGAVAEIFKGQGKIPIIGAVIAAAMIGGLFAAIAKASSVKTAADVSSPADGKTIISTKEGGLFELSPNDDLVAAPGAASALANATNGTGATANGEGGINVNVNLSQLAAPLTAMINEIKGLRADMASGKIGVYMDTEKVTSKIGKQVDQSTRNNYSLGQA
jgi:hypothetical protein